MSKLRLLLVTAGLSEPSTTALLGQQLADATQAALAAYEQGSELTHIPLRSLAQEISNHYLTGFPGPTLAQALDQVREADAIIVVSPVFKASYSGLFKSFWDLVEDGALAGKPLLLAASGGTARHSLVLETALRPLFSYLKALVAPTGVFAATDDFGNTSLLSSRIVQAAEEFTQLLVGQQGGRKLADQANAGSFFGDLSQAQQADRSPQTYKGPGLSALKVTPFEELLRQNSGPQVAS